MNSSLFYTNDHGLSITGQMVESGGVYRKITRESSVQHCCSFEVSRFRSSETSKPETSKRSTGHTHTSSSASAASFASVSAFIAERMVTVFSQKVMPFDFSKRPFITRAAAGAQLPFSTRPTSRFW